MPSPRSAAHLAAAMLLLLAAPVAPAALVREIVRQTVKQTVRCPSDCTAVLQRALSGSHGHIVVQPPLQGGPATVGGPDVSTRLLANGTGMTIELAPGLVLVGFLNTTFAPSTGSDPARGYSPALVTLEIKAARFTLLGHDSVLRHITAYVAGTNVRIESVRFVDPGWYKGFDIIWDHVFLPPTHSSALHHPARAVRPTLLGGHAGGTLIGACDPMA